MKKISSTARERRDHTHFSDPLALDSVRVKAAPAEHGAAPLVIVEGTFALALPELIAVATLTVHVGLGVRTPPRSHPVPVRSGQVRSCSTAPNALSRSG
ncbi:hypothetical protein ABT144_07540 [Streptomyces sp. NPDC002039]|uniref:hypothetical protein n=1 Tax=Streptomyces sp. NPDC002039 TaxID=3154660 RepID=UPI00332A8872